MDLPLRLPTVRRGDVWIARAGTTELRLSNLDKVFWPERGITKGDLLDYYFNVSQALLPHVARRPLTLKRLPDGMQGGYWYEKDAPAYTPEWVPVLPIEAESGERTIRFVAIDGVASLLWVVHIGCLEIHPHHSRGPQQRFPTYAVFDLDPFPPAGWREVVYASGLVRTVLDGLGLDAFVKTSGGTGVHIYVPSDGGAPYDDVRRLVTRVSELVNAADPEVTTLEWEVKRRSGKVFLDVNMNRAGATLAAPYSVRARWGAPVSTPVGWDELPDTDPSRFTMEVVVERLHEREDPFAALVDHPGHDLGEAGRALGIGTA